MDGTEAAPWGQGYPTGAAYLETYQDGLSPDAMAIVALARHLRLPGPSLRYLELGCGQGVSLVAHAACRPDATFLGVDVMPDHVAAARAMVADAGLTNIRIEEADFGALARKPPEDGPYDMVALHGVWSWVSASVREDLLSLFDTWVAPGGFVQASYNARPFWNQVEPLRYVLRELLGPEPGPKQFDTLRRTVDAWVERTDSAAIQSFWQRLRPLPDRYFMHEFASREATAFWPQDVEHDFGRARLKAVGQIPLSLNFEALALNKDQRDLLDWGTEAGIPATAADIAAGRSLRIDMFTRGAPALTTPEVIRTLAGYEVLTARPRPTDTPKSMLSGGLADRLSRLTSGRMQVAEALEVLGDTPARALQTLLVGVALEMVELCRPVDAAARASMTAFNAMSLERARDGAPLPCLICLERGRPQHLSRSEATHVATGESLPEEKVAWLDGFDFSAG